MAFNDFYAVLELAQNCTPKELTTAYRSLALRLHPDKNAGNPHATENFQLLGTAYEILKDEQKRKVYDIKYQEYRYSQPAPQAPNLKLLRKHSKLVESIRALSKERYSLEHAQYQTLGRGIPEGYEDYAAYGGDEEEVQAAILAHLDTRLKANEKKGKATYILIKEVEAQLRA